VGGLSPDETSALSQAVAPSNSAQSTTTANLALKSLVKGASPQVWLTLNPPGSRMGFIAPRRSNSGSHEALQVKSAQVDFVAGCSEISAISKFKLWDANELPCFTKIGQSVPCVWISFVVNCILYLAVEFSRASAVAPRACNGLL
jgi:hypothetical protein